jgi:hypothetical protein
MDLPLLERNRMAEEKGAWWEVPYWRNPRYVGLEDYTAVDIEEAFQALARIYDAKWFLQRTQDQRDGWEWWLRAHRAAGESPERVKLKPRHPVHSHLCGDGPMVVVYLLRHGRALVAAARLGLLAPYKDRLRDPENFEGAWFELDLISRLAQAGAQVLPAAAGAMGNRRCEFRARLGAEDLHIEAKYLTPAPANQIVSQLEDALHQVLMVAPCTHQKAYVNYYETLPSFRSEVLSGEGPKGLARRWPSIEQTITAHLEDVVERQAWGHHEITGVLRYHIIPVTEGMSYVGQGGGLEISKGAEVLKIIQRGIEEAGAQLPAGAAGLLIVHSDEANRFRLLTEDFRAALEARPALGGLLVVDRARRPQFIPNPGAHTPISGYAVLEAILNQPHGVLGSIGG